ncbi:MAG: hypothetical protein Q9160_001229 [Pyrenula sp. 1 TL-2023]
MSQPACNQLYMLLSRSRIFGSSGHLFEVPAVTGISSLFSIFRISGQRSSARAHCHRQLSISASLHESSRIFYEETSPELIVGQSGRAYAIDRVLQDKGAPFGRVCLAKYAPTPRPTAKCANGEIKERQFKICVERGPKENYQLRLNIYNILGRRTQHVRLLEDTVEERATFVHKYFNDNLLALVQRGLPHPVTKKILKDVLRGLADLHEVDIVHNDIKANNVLINTEETPTGIKVLKTQLGDLEDAAHVPLGRVIKGAQVGNWMWRSPEAHAQGPIQKPSDMFSFGIICIYAITKKVIFYVSEEEVGEGGEILSFVLERHLSYFAEEDTLEAFLRYLGESPWVEIFQVLRSGFNKENPREPFSLWQHDEISDDFKDLIGGLTSFDPTKRLTAQEALTHRWFRDV